MNYYEARQREKDKRWDYTRRNDSRIWPVGYCGGWRFDREPPPGLHNWEQTKAKYEPFRANYHTDGHETREEAEACYRRYELDTELHFGTLLNQRLRCDVCEQFTDGTANTRHFHAIVCAAHQTREAVERLMIDQGYPGAIMSSY